MTNAWHMIKPLGFFLVFFSLRLCGLAAPVCVSFSFSLLHLTGSWWTFLFVLPGGFCEHQWRETCTRVVCWLVGGSCFAPCAFLSLSGGSSILPRRGWPATFLHWHIFFFYCIHTPTEAQWSTYVRPFSSFFALIFTHCGDPSITRKRKVFRSYSTSK